MRVSRLTETGRGHALALGTILVWATTFIASTVALRTLTPVELLASRMADVVEIITAVGNHEEQSGTVSSALSAALIIADKSDAHKSRVRNGRPDPTDVHDRVNFSIQQNDVTVDRKTRLIRQSLTMDNSSSVLEYLSIYMPRIIMCEKAAAFLGQSFQLVINGHAVNNQTPDPQVVAQ